jgi:hypothetical protein
MATPTTLPASFTAGQVLTAAQMNNLRGAFRVLQVVQTSTTTPTDNSTTSFVDTSLTGTITLQSNTNKVLIFVQHGNCRKSAGNAGNALSMFLQRNGSNLVKISNLMANTGTTLDLRFGISAVYLDSPASTSALTYKTQFANNVAAAVVSVQQDGLESTITLVEISA